METKHRNFFFRHLLFVTASYIQDFCTLSKYPHVALSCGEAVNVAVAVMKESGEGALFGVGRQ
ncbi:MAG: hypothetical protein LBU04_07515 [Christensenellaceae bacterium]|nr:hypothetical protein [Christensenellaceae bacterium]